MKAWVVVLLVFLLLLQSSSVNNRNKILNDGTVIEVLSVYEVAELITGAPANILKAIAITESNENDDAVGDDGISRGRMQLNELYHDERVMKYGEYNPFNSLESVVIAGFLFMDNLVRLGDIDKAIAAHRQGVNGVRKYGASEWYVNRVKSNL